VDVVADLPADAQPPEPVQQGEALLDDPAVHAQPGAVLRVDKTEGPLNFLKADLKGRIIDLGSLERTRNAVGELQQVVKLRRGQAHSGAAPDSLRAAARLGIRLTGDWAESWNRVRQVTIDAVYTLIDELEPGRT
jgi:hypothetical protein